MCIGQWSDGDEHLIKENRKPGSGHRKHRKSFCKMDMIWGQWKKERYFRQEKVYSLRYGGRNELGLFS